MQLPYEWHRQNEKCRICNYVRDGVSIEELVDVDATCEAAWCGRSRRISCPKRAHRLTLEDCDQNLSKCQNVICARGDFGAHHSNPPSTDYCHKDIDWNADFALLEYSPVECQQGELDTADDAGIADFCDEKAFGPCGSGVWRSTPDMASEAMIDH